MKVVAERRACSIIRNLLVSAEPGIFLLPANVCPVVPLTCMTAGRPFEFIDIDPVDLCMCRAAVERRLKAKSPRVAGVLFVRTYGGALDVSEAFTTWKRNDPDLLLIDDRCLCPPEVADCDSQGADVVLFSTGYGKFVDLGGGGFACLADDVDYLRSAVPFVQEAEVRLTNIYKRQIDEGGLLSASMASPHLDHWLPSAPLQSSVRQYLEDTRTRLAPVSEQKALINEIYRKAIPERFQLRPDYWRWRFQIRVPDKRRLLERIFEAGFFASGHYYPASRLFDGSPCPQAEALYADVVNLFNDFAATPESATGVAKVVRQHAGG